MLLWFHGHVCFFRHIHQSQQQDIVLSIILHFSHQTSTKCGLAGWWLQSSFCGSIYSLTNLRFSSVQTLQFALIKFPVSSSNSPVHFALIFPAKCNEKKNASPSSYSKANLGLIFKHKDSKMLISQKPATGLPKNRFPFHGQEIDMKLPSISLCFSATILDYTPFVSVNKRGS